MKRIIKVNRHTADVICSLSLQEFLREKEIQNKTMEEVSKFEESAITHSLTTTTYIYLYVPKQIINQ